MINRVIVLGGGSAGLMAAIALKKKLPDLSVTCVRSSAIGVIGVGEGSTPPLTDFLHGYIGVSSKKYFDIARPTWKLGLKFLWGSRDFFFYPFGKHLTTTVSGLPRAGGFYCDEDQSYEDLQTALMAEGRVFVRTSTGAPAFHNDVAYHFENERLVEFLEGFAAAVGVTLRDDTLLEVHQDEGGIRSLSFASGITESADLYVDCSGFGSTLLGKALGEPFISYRDTLFCDRAIVGGWTRRPEEPILPYTTCETMSAGWAWQIEHESRINRGYVYSSAFLHDESAEHEFRSKNPHLGPTRIVPFVSGRYQRAWVKNVVAIGNSSGFVEPLEATALGVISLRCRRLTDALLAGERRLSALQIDLFNRENAANWDSIRDFLAVHYRFNNRMDTPFWRECQEKVELGAGTEFVEYYRDSGPNPYWGPALFGPFEAIGTAGYLALLVGQRVPYQTARPASAAELAIWKAFQTKLRQQAQKAMTVCDVLKVIRSPAWRWT